MDEGRCQRRLEDGVGSPGFGGLQVVVSCPVQVWETELWPSAQHLLNNNNNNDNSNNSIRGLGNWHSISATNYLRFG